MRVAIFTAVYGEYDNVYPAVKQDIEVDFLIWGIDASGWCRQPDREIQENNRLTNRSIKILSHQLDYDYTIYIDGSIHINDEHFATWFIDQTTSWGAYQHHCRNTVAEEQAECMSRNMDIRCDIISEYLSEGFGDNCLYANTVICRESKCPKVKETEDLWHNEVMEKSCRDQLSLPYCLWRTGLKPSIIPGHICQSPHHGNHVHIKSHG